MAAEIKKAKGVETTLVKGGNGIFDVYSGDKLVFSKYEEHRFPDAAEVIAELE